MEQPEEHRPFLELEEGDGEQDTTRNEALQSQFTTKSQLVIVLLLSLLLLAMSNGRILSTVALFQQQEEIICHQFLSSNGDNGGYDKTCRSPKGETAPEVVHELGLIVNWDSVLSLFPGILVAIPFGLAADQHGRKKFLMLSSGGIAVSAALRALICLLSGVFPLRLVWLASLFTSITGGYMTFFAMLFAIAADISSTKRMCMLFFYLGLVGMISSSLGTYISLNISASASLFVGVGCHAICPCVAWFIQDTHTGVASQSKTDLGTTELSYLLNVKTVLSEAARILRLACRDNKRLGALLLALLLVVQLGDNGELSLHIFMIIPFFWTIFLILLGLIPCYRSPLSKDLWLARIIVCISLPGAFLFAFSNKKKDMFNMFVGMIFLSICDAYPLVTRSLLVNLNNGEDIAALYSLMGVVQGVVRLLSSPTSALLDVMGVVGRILQFVSYALSAAVLFSIWPRQSDEVVDQRTERG